MNWELTNETDLMGNEIKMKCVSSPSGRLSIRYRSDNGLSILYNSFIGNGTYYTIKHTIYREKYIKVKFDDKIVRFNIETAVNNNDVFFITEIQLFLRYLKQCKNIVIEYYTLDGTYQVPFNVEEYEDVYKNIQIETPQQSNNDKKMLGVPDKYWGIMLGCLCIVFMIITIFITTRY